MSNFKKTKSGFIWVFFGTAGQNLLQFAALMVLARMLTPQEFGVVGAAMIIIGLINIFAELGIGPAIIQKMDLTKKDVGTGKVISASIGVLSGIIVYCLSGLFESFMKIEGLSDVVKILAFVLPVSGLTVIGQSLLQRNLQFKKYILSVFISFFISQLLVAIPLALLGFSYYSLIIATLVQNIVLLFLVTYLTREYIGWSFSLASAKHLSNYGLGQSLGKFSNYLAGQGDNFIIGRQLGTSDLGSYGRAYQLLMVPANLIGSVLDKLLFPLMSESQKNNTKLADIYILSMSIVCMLTIPITAFVFVCSEEIIELLLGKQWSEVAPLLKILICVLFFRTSYKISDSLSRAKGSVYKRAWRQAIYAFLVFIFSYIGSFYGVHGVAYGVSVAIVINYLLMLHLSKSLIGFSYLLVIKPFFMGFLLLLFLIAFPTYVSSLYEFNLIIKLILTLLSIVFLYLNAIYLLRDFLQNELQFLRKALRMS